MSLDPDMAAAVGTPLCNILPTPALSHCRVTCQCARRWQAAADLIARDCAAEQDALQQLRLPGSLPSADAALALGHDIIARAHQHGAVAVSEELLQQLAERCTEAGERDRSWHPVLWQYSSFPQMPNDGGVGHCGSLLCWIGRVNSATCCVMRPAGLETVTLGLSMTVAVMLQSTGGRCSCWHSIPTCWPSRKCRACCQLWLSKGSS